MTIWVGDATGVRRQVIDPWVGDAGGTKRQVQKVYVGDATGVPRLVFTREVAAPPLVLNAVAASSTQINLTWTGGVSPYVLRRGSGVIYSGAALAFSDTGRSPSTAYSYSLTDAVGTVVSKSASTPARPSTTTTVTLNPRSAGSYRKSNLLRTDTPNFYSGQYDGTHSFQRSSFHYPIPDNVRNCIEITKVEWSARNLHSWSNGGVTQYIAITHTADAGSTWPGSTAPFAPRATAKGGWWGNAQWQDITSLAVPTTGGTVADNFRSKGAWGICLHAPDTSIGWYSYWAPQPQLRITYRYYTA